jgi:hypothetical protein
MTIYLGGDEVEVRIGTTASAVTSNTAIPYINSVTLSPSQNLEEVPKGLGQGRTQEVHEKLVSLTGTIERFYDETTVSQTDDFAEVVDSFGTGDITGLYLQVKNKTTSKTWLFSGVKGEYSQDSPVDGFVSETYDWFAEGVSVTT